VARITQEIKKTSNKVIIINDSNFLIRKKAVGSVALKALNYLGYTRIYLNLIFTSDSKIKQLNKRFLNHNRATDVLAFPATVIPASFNRESIDSRHIFGEERQVLPRTLSEMSDKAHPEKCSRKGRAAKCSAHIIVGNTSKLPRLVLAHWRLHWARALRHSEMTFFLGEVIISPKRALLQAPLYQASFQEELARYICHGILHLAGFKDKTKPQKNEMRKKEDEILSLSKSYINRIV